MRLIASITAALLTVTLAAPASAEIRHEHLINDRKGIEPSLYVGKWYSPRHDDFRRCIMRRESRGNYRAANPRSSARGAYQFLDSQWRDGLVWMMLKEEKRTGGDRRREIRRLFDKPIHRWNRYYQDRAFWTAFRHGDGAHHWHYPGSPCNRLA